MSDFTDTPFGVEDEATGTALDRFAGLGGDEARGNAMIPQQAFSPAGERIIGAQHVAVRRNAQAVLSKLRTLGAAAGEDWYYRFPVKNRRENRTDWIEGPSIKLANDLAREYGNCDIDVRVTDLGDTWLFYARFTDFETGFSMARPFQQAKGGSRLGGADDARRLDIALQIGASKAIRNVVVNALQTYSDFAFAEAKRALVDRIGKELPRWRQNTIRRLQEHVEIARVERVIGRPSEDWLAPDVARVIAMMKAVSDGMASMDDTFPSLIEEQAPQTGAQKATSSAQLDRFAGEQTKAGEPAKGRAAAPDAGPIPAHLDRSRQQQAAQQEGEPKPEEYDPPSGEEARQAGAAAAEQPPPRRRGRPTNAEIAARKAAEAAQTGVEGEAGQDSGRQENASEGAAQGPASAFRDELEREADSEDAERDERIASAEDAYRLAEELIGACEKALTVERMEAVAASFRERVKALPGKEDRLDVSEIGNAYMRFRRGTMSGADLGDEIDHRRQLIKERAAEG